MFQMKSPGKNPFQTFRSKPSTSPCFLDTSTSAFLAPPCGWDTRMCFFKSSFFVGYFHFSTCPSFPTSHGDSWTAIGSLKICANQIFCRQMSKLHHYWFYSLPSIISPSLNKYFWKPQFLLFLRLQLLFLYFGLEWICFPKHLQIPQFSPKS